jgi:hypothetical protein
MKIRCSHSEIVSVAELKNKFHPKNHNNHPDDQIKQLATILEYQGVRYPVKISNQSGKITSGHGRVLAAQKLGWTDFPVDYQDYDSPAQEYADVQADNAIASWAELNLDGIKDDIKEFESFDVDSLGIKNFMLEPEEKSEPEFDLIEQKHIYEVVVSCADESEQEQIYNRLTQDGLKCRVLSM